MLSARRDTKATERFFKKVLKASHSSNPRVINVEKNAAYPPAVSDLKKENILSESCELRQVKYFLQQSRRNCPLISTRFSVINLYNFLRQRSAAVVAGKDSQPA